MPDAFARRGLRRPTRFVRHSGARRRCAASRRAPAARRVSGRRRRCAAPLRVS
ncbi:dihydrolipoamide dehydrogenase, partial [Burkholderia pseudomallei]